MTDTKTYPTPAGDALAQAKPPLTEQIHAAKMTLTHQLSHEQGAALRARYSDWYGRAPKSSMTRPDLVEAIVIADIDGLPGKAPSYPATLQLKRLTRNAAIEERILADVQEYNVDRVDAEFRMLAAANATTAVNPEWMANTAMTWQAARGRAIAWNFVAKTIEKGETPIEAARQAVRYFMRELVQKARGDATMSIGMRSMLDTQEASAFAKFIDQLAYLDGIVDPAAF